MSTLTIRKAIEIEDAIESDDADENNDGEGDDESLKGEDVMIWELLRNTGDEEDDDDDEEALGDEEYDLQHERAFDEHFEFSNECIDECCTCNSKDESVPELSAEKVINKHLYPVQLALADPTESDHNIFALKTKVGEEISTLLVAFREQEKRRVEGISSVFHIKHVPGRIFVEATSLNAVFDLLKPSVTIRWGNQYMVPTNERIALLSRARKEKELTSLYPGSFVLIRSGLYRGDIAQILPPFIDKPSLLSLKLLPRLLPPAFQKPSKRARKTRSRPSPRRTPFLEARSIYGVDKVIPTEDSYEFMGNTYDADGFRLLRLRYDAVRDYKPSMREISPFIDATVESLQRIHGNVSDLTQSFSDDDVFRASKIDIEYLSLNSDVILRTGSRVRILEGWYKGQLGIVINAPDTNIVTVTTEGEPSFPVDIPRSALRWEAKVGDPVLIKYGSCAGRVGKVEHRESLTLIVKEDTTSMIMRVCEVFVELACYEVCSEDSSNTTRSSHGEQNHVLNAIWTRYVPQGIDRVGRYNEGKMVYVWKGSLKGMVGRVLSIGGKTARIALAGLMRGKIVHEIKREDLLNEKVCSIMTGKIPLCCKPHREELRQLIMRLINPVPLSSKEPVPPLESFNLKVVAETPKHHHVDVDPRANMMWIFNPVIAMLRKTYDIPIKFLDVDGFSTAGRRNGRIMRSDTPREFPLKETEPAVVQIEFTDNKGRVVRQEAPVKGLSAWCGSHGCELVIIKGDRMGEIVKHVRTVQDMIKVKRPEGGPLFMLPKSDVSRIEKAKDE